MISEEKTMGRNRYRTIWISDVTGQRDPAMTASDTVELVTVATLDCRYYSAIDVRAAREAHERFLTYE